MATTSSNQEAYVPPPDPQGVKPSAPSLPGMIAKVAPPGDPLTEDYVKDRERNRRLREVRDEVQDLRAVLDSVRKGETSLPDFADYVEHARQDVNTLLKDMPGADPVRRICNTWQQIQASPLIQNPRGAIDAQTQLHHLTLLESHCRRLVLQVGMLTIPERVNEWLRVARSGYYIPFHMVFEDELPDIEDRVKVLNYLAWAPKALLGGLVNTETGLIYRYSQDPVHRLLSLAGALAAFVAATLLIVGACYLPIQDWPLQSPQLATMLIGWTAVVMGVIVHIAVGTAKRAQAEGGRPPIIAIEDTLLWANARFGHILVKILLALIGFFGVVFTAGQTPGIVTPLGMFLVGYSLDSVVEVFGIGLEQRATAHLALLKRQMGTQPEA
jgi:hypothetical protein